MQWHIENMKRKLNENDCVYKIGDIRCSLTQSCGGNRISDQPALLSLWVGAYWVVRKSKITDFTMENWDWYFSFFLLRYPKMQVTVQYKFKGMPKVWCFKNLWSHGWIYAFLETPYLWRDTCWIVTKKHLISSIPVSTLLELWEFESIKINSTNLHSYSMLFAQKTAIFLIF